MTVQDPSSPAEMPPVAVITGPEQMSSPKPGFELDNGTPQRQYFGSGLAVGFPHRVNEAAYSAASVEQGEPAGQVFRALAITTQEYLLELFWSKYNRYVLLVSKDHFYQGQASANSTYYSSFLHLTMLAMGFRFADPGRNDIRKISLGNRISMIHQVSRFLIEHEPVRPNAVSNVQALLILGDLEFGVGQNEAAWLYSGASTEYSDQFLSHLRKWGSKC
jgi:hypothetical protein